MPTINISDKDIELLKAVLETMKASISWDEVARKANMKTSKYARDRWTVVSNKIIAGEGGGKATAGGKRKDSATASPGQAFKKSKTTARKQAPTPKVKSEDNDEAEEDIFE